jgi:hypothetical protein
VKNYNEKKVTKDFLNRHNIVVAKALKGYVKAVTTVGVLNLAKEVWSFSGKIAMEHGGTLKKIL